MKTVAIFDLDSTITNCDTFVSFLLYVLSTSPLRCLRALWLPIALLAYYCGLRNNTWLKKKFLGTIAGGASRADVEKWSKHFVEQLHISGIRPCALQAIAQHRALGHYIVLASASFEFYVVPLAKSLGFDSVIATKAVWSDDQLCGEILGDNCYGRHKFEKVVEFLQQNIPDCHTIAYSDHHTDIQLLLWANEAYAVNPNKKLKKWALAHNVSILDWNA